MATSVKELLAAASAADPKIGREAEALIADSDLLVVGVRDAPQQVAGKIKGAKHVSRDMLEFKAEPAFYTDIAFQVYRTLLPYMASAAARHGATRCCGTCVKRTSAISRRSRNWRKEVVQWNNCRTPCRLGDDLSIP